MPISVSSGHFALRYEVPKFLARGGHLCMAVLTIAAANGPPAAREAARHGGEPREVGRASWTEPTESPAEAA